MDEMNFGDVLRQAREQSGEDLVSVARRIRIRPDILERIESSDVDSMPPRGYSRNMINAYARYLGLNTTEVVKMYQDAQYRSQVEHARENIKPTGIDMPATRKEALFDRHQDEVRRIPSVESPRETGGRRYSDRLAAGSRPSARSSSRASGVSPRPHSSGYVSPSLEDIDAAIAPPKDSTNRIGAVHVGSYNAYGQGLSQRNARRADDSAKTRRIEPVHDSHRHDARSTHKARRSTMPGEHYTNLYAAPKNIGVRPSDWRDKIPFVIAGIVILLLVVLVAAFANGMGRAQTTPAPESTPMNVTGLPGSTTSQDSSSGESASATDGGSTTESSDTASAAAQSSTPAAPEKTVMEFDIPEGVTTYYEVYVDGAYVDGGNVTGPKSQSYDVTGTFEFHVTPPDGVTLTQDGTAVSLEAGSAGVASVTVDFADVLAKWNEEHASDASSESASS